MSQQSASSEAALDRLVGGKYRIVRLIATGGMGSVHEAVHVRTGGRVALKILSDEAKQEESSRQRFAREARAAGRLRGRHVARVLDVDALDDGTPYLVMELLEGRDLAKEVKERGPLSVVEAADIVLQAAAGLAEAHAAGIVHRDLKPGNVFLAEEGAHRIAKVLDFGISKVKADADEEEITRTFATVGTPAYMSPEQIRTPKDVDAATDIWSLGVILYRLLAGRMPFTGNSSSVAVSICSDTPPPLSSVREDVPSDLSAIVDAALSKDRTQRPSLRAIADVLVAHVESAVAREAHAEIARVAKHLPTPQASKTPDETTVALAGTVAPRRGSSAAWLAFAIVSMLALGAFAAARLPSSRTEEPKPQAQAPHPTVSVAATPSEVATSPVETAKSAVPSAVPSSVAPAATHAAPRPKPTHAPAPPPATVPPRL